MSFSDSLNKFFRKVWSVLQVVGLLILVALGGWALWKYVILKIWPTTTVGNLHIEVTNPNTTADAQSAVTIESALNRLLGK